MIVTEEAFEELLDRAELAEGEAEGDGEEREARRRQFTVTVDRAVKKVVARRDRRAWHTQTLRRYGCRIHFLRNENAIYLIACLPLDADDRDHST